MPFKGKHIGNLFASVIFFNNRKNLTVLLLTVFSLLVFLPGFAIDNNIKSVYSTGKTTIVYSMTDSNQVVITEGKVTAVEGKTIHLLPGTWIKSDEQLTVNIASKTCQKEVAVKVEKAKENNMLASAAKQREEVLLQEETTEIPFDFTYCPLPEQNTQIGQQSQQLTALTVTTSVSFSAPVVILHKKNSDLSRYNSEALACQFDFTPVFSWGEFAGTIKVMRC